MTVYTVTTLDDPFANGGTSAYGINNTGQIVGSYSVVGVSPITHQGYGFLYNRQDGTYTTLEDPHTFHGGVAPGTSAQGINDLGQVVGDYAGLYNGVGGTHGFFYSSGTYTTLDDPLAGPLGTFAYGINNAGQIVGYYITGSGVDRVNHGFLYSNGTYTTLDDPLAGPLGTFAYGINNAGQIVGSYNDASGVGSHGFLYSVSSGTYTTLDDPAGTVTVATGINDLGQIVGYYFPAGAGGGQQRSSTARALTSPWTSLCWYPASTTAASSWEV
jgi:probable HAF family extracellular repeat protein